MSFVLSLVLPAVVSLLMAALSTALWRSSLPSPTVFFAVAFLALLGLDRVLHAALELWRLVSPRGYFLEQPDKVSTIEALQRTMTTEALAMALALVVVGWPMLSLLRSFLASIVRSTG